jgi:hypothetical protein
VIVDLDGGQRAGRRRRRAGDGGRGPVGRAAEERGADRERDG